MKFCFTKLLSSLNFAFPKFYLFQINLKENVNLTIHYVIKQVNQSYFSMNQIEKNINQLITLNCLKNFIIYYYH